MCGVDIDFFDIDVFGDVVMDVIEWIFWGFGLVAVVWGY